MEKEKKNQTNKRVNLVQGEIHSVKGSYGKKFIRALNTKRKSKANVYSFFTCLSMRVCLYKWQSIVHHLFREMLECDYYTGHRNRAARNVL